MQAPTQRRIRLEKKTNRKACVFWIGRSESSNLTWSTSAVGFVSVKATANQSYLLMVITLLGTARKPPSSSRITGPRSGKSRMIRDHPLPISLTTPSSPSPQSCGPVLIAFLQKRSDIFLEASFKFSYRDCSLGLCSPGPRGPPWSSASKPSKGEPGRWQPFFACHRNSPYQNPAHLVADLCKSPVAKPGCANLVVSAHPPWSSVFLALWGLKTLLLKPAITIATLARASLEQGLWSSSPCGCHWCLGKARMASASLWLDLPGPPTVDSHIDSCPLHVDGAIPQGCPLSPMLLAVVTSAGCRRTRGGTNIKQCVYMDDRTFWAATQ